MTKSKTLATSLLSLSAAALLAVCAAGGASAAPASPQDGGQVASQAVDATNAASYWTA